MRDPDAPLIDRIQANFVDYFRQFAGLPGITFVDDDATWFVNTTAGGEPTNYILQARWSGATADAEIDRLLARIAEQANYIDWLVFPGCRPGNLGERLRQRGLQGRVAGTWMTADLTNLPPAAPTPAGFTVREVHDNAMLAEWKQVSSAGFGEDGQIYYDAYVRHGYGPDAAARHYTGYEDGQPATSGTVLLSGGIPGLYNISTPPAYRGRGCGRALTAHMLQELVACGQRMAWTWASDAGKSTYSRLGFVEHDFGVREYPWRASAAGE